MPLSEPADRKPLHRRDITLRGYERADGLFDIEAHLVDTKSYEFSNHDRGVITVGEPLHDMWARMTVDEDLLITAFEAATERSPYAICPQAAPNFARLVGLTIGRGFLRAAAQRVGGVIGCTHLRELLQQMATVAYQTLVPVREGKAAGARRRAGMAAKRPDRHDLPQLNTCLAYDENGPLVRRLWPQSAEPATELASEAD